jgi:radical SAM protein with 4Fe4S-binding SPASM domain
MKITFLQIEPTNLCNLNCVMCTRHNLRRYGNLTLEGLERIIEQIPTVKAVKLQGMGEPMLNPWILPMAEYLRSRRIRVYAVMNGTILPDNLDAFLSAMNRIEYSIDSVDSKEYEIIRGIDSAKQVIENFRLLCNARKEGHRTMISINCVLVCANESRIEKLFALAKDTHSDNINFYFAQNWTVDGNCGGKRRNNGSTLEMAEAINKLSRKYRMRAVIRKPISGLSNCKWAASGCYITWDGFVTPCCQRPDPDEINFGNINENDFSTIYCSPVYETFRKMILNGKEPRECSNCSVFTHKQSEKEYALSCNP